MSAFNIELSDVQKAELRQVQAFLKEHPTVLGNPDPNVAHERTLELRSQLLANHSNILNEVIGKFELG